MAENSRIQLQLRNPYKFQPSRHRAVRERLDEGWVVEDYHRLSDQEVVVTMVRPSDDDGAGGASTDGA